MTTQVTTIDCEFVRKLVPLHVEGDLRPRHATPLRAHLDGCVACRELQEQFRQSQRALRTYRPEATGDELDEMRRGVWRRLDNQTGPSPLWLQIERAMAWLRYWAAKPSVAVATVVLVSIGSFALSRLGGFGARSVLTAERAPAQAGQAGMDPASPPEHLADRMVLAQAEEEEFEGVEGDGDSELEAADDHLRIEIQTGDPDVRIIWFSPQDKAGSVEN